MHDIRYLHKEFKLRYNAIDSNHKKDYPAAFIDDFYNTALFDYVEIFATGNNAKRYRIGFEVTQQRTDMISTLVISDSMTPTAVVDGVYEFNLDSLSERYFHLVRASANTDCGTINIKPEQHDDLNYVLSDEYCKPSRKWKRLISTIKRSSSGEGSSVYVYTNNEFNLDGINIEYIKYPRKVFFGGYNSLECDGTNYCIDSPSVDPDIPYAYYSVLVDLAVQEASRALYDVNQINIREQKISSL